MNICGNMPVFSSVAIGYQNCTVYFYLNLPANGKCMHYNAYPYVAIMEGQQGQLTPHFSDCGSAIGFWPHLFGGVKKNFGAEIRRRNYVMCYNVDKTIEVMTKKGISLLFMVARRKFLGIDGIWPCICQMLPLPLCILVMHVYTQMMPSIPCHQCCRLW